MIGVRLLAGKIVAARLLTEIFELVQAKHGCFEVPVRHEERWVSMRATVYPNGCISLPGLVAQQSSHIVNQLAMSTWPASQQQSLTLGRSVYEFVCRVRYPFAYATSVFVSLGTYFWFPTGDSTMYVMAPWVQNNKEHDRHSNKPVLPKP